MTDRITIEMNKSGAKPEAEISSGWDIVGYAVSRPCILEVTRTCSEHIVRHVCLSTIITSAQNSELGLH